MDAHEAREHLEMVDEILRRGEGSRTWSCRQLGLTLIAIGAGAAILNVGFQLGGAAASGSWAGIGGLALILIGLLYMVVSIARSRRDAQRMPLAEVRAGRVMSAVWTSVLVAAFCQPHLFSGWSASAIWSLGGAISLLVNGFFGDRRALGGGIALLAAMLVANYVPSITGYALAAGFGAGYVLVGVLYLTGAGEPRDRG